MARVIVIAVVVTLLLNVYGFFNLGDRFTYCDGLILYEQTINGRDAPAECYEQITPFQEYINETSS